MKDDSLIIERLLEIYKLTIVTIILSSRLHTNLPNHKSLPVLALEPLEHVEACALRVLPFVFAWGFRVAALFVRIRLLLFLFRFLLFFLLVVIIWLYLRLRAALEVLHIFGEVLPVLLKQRAERLSVLQSPLVAWPFAHLEWGEEVWAEGWEGGWFYFMWN